MHPLDSVGIDAANSLVQYYAAEHLDAGYDLHHERGATRRFGNMVLEYNAAHATHLGELRHIDVVHVATEHVRVRMHVHVDDAGGRTDFWRWRRETGLGECIIVGQQGQRSC